MSLTTSSWAKKHNLSQDVVHTERQNGGNGLKRSGRANAAAKIMTVFAKSFRAKYPYPNIQTNLRKNGMLQFFDKKYLYHFLMNYQEMQKMAQDPCISPTMLHV